MRKVCIISAAVLAMAVGCKKEEIRYDDDGNQIVSLDVRLPSVATTKGSNLADELNINTVQIFVFRENGILEGYKYDTTASSSIRFECIAGNKDIVAIVNGPQLSSKIKTFSALKKSISALRDNKTGSLVMYGATRQLISKANSTVNMSVSRLVSRVWVSEVKNSLQQIQYRSSKFEVKRVYLINVAGDMEYDGNAEATVWYNVGEYDDQAKDVLGLIASGNLNNSPTAHGEICYIGHFLYCYPNSATEENAQTVSHKPTRIVVEVAIDDLIYYYPITIPDVKSGHRYDIKLEVKRPGSLSPDTPISVEDCGVTVYINPWIVGFNQSVII